MNRAALRFAALYGAIFLALGIFLPFWPVFLEYRGLSGAEIGTVLALGTWLKAASNPAIGRLADRGGQRRVMTLLAAFATVVAVAFLFARDFWSLLLLHILVFPAFQAMIPIGDSQCLATAARGGLDYGRVRLWGSIAFMLAVLGMGELLEGRTPQLVAWAVVGAFAVLLAVTLALPRAGAPEEPRAHGRVRTTALFADRPFVLFLGVGALLQSSHAVYYAFSAVYWKAQGISAATVGWLWAEGVIAEVLLFAVGGRLLARLGPVGLLLVAAAGGVIRWTTLGLSTDIAVLVLVQGLHAATFAAAHLGAVHFIARRAPAALHSTAQGISSAASGGLGMGLAMLGAGPLYDAVGGRAFLAMAAMSAVAGMLALALYRRTPPRPAAGQRVP